ncbi:MAG TPA: phenylalanine--tRNA ligase subunit beta [Caulobacteraceae bacterium]
MKFTLSWLKEHLKTDAELSAIVEAMTMAGLNVEHVVDPAQSLAAFSVAKIIEAAPHPNADRLRVCQAQTKDGIKVIVCGAPNARAGLTTIYAPIGAFIPGAGITLEPRAVRGVVSNGMLCSGAELQTTEDADGIIELAELPVGTPAAEGLKLEAVIDFEVTPNRPDWLGVAGIARDLAAAGVGEFIDDQPMPVPGVFPCPIEIRLSAPQACPQFAGRLVRRLANGPSPAWLQQRLKAVGLRPINALVDVTNLLTQDRARPLHVYDAALITGGFIEARLGRAGERIEALDGRTHEVGPQMCVIADGSGAIGLGGVIGGVSTRCSASTTEVFIESAWFDPTRTAQTGRATGIVSDAQYRFARGVDPRSLIPGIEAATALILALCGGEASEVVFAGEPPPLPAPVDFDPAYVERLSGLAVPPERSAKILADLGFRTTAGRVQPPSWRADVHDRADLVEEIVRIEGYAALPSTPLPPLGAAPGGVLTVRQNRIRTARRALAAEGYLESVGFSFIPRAHAALFGGGQQALILDNPLSAELDCMRPSILPSLIATLDRNLRRGFAEAAIFEIGPVFAGDAPGEQRTAITALLAPGAPRRWDKQDEAPIFVLKADLLALLDELGAPTGQLQIAQGEAAPWWRPGCSARLRLGKTILAEFGELHPAVLEALGIDRSVHAFEFWLETLPEPRRKAGKTRPPANLSAFMPLTRDFAFVVAKSIPAGDLVRAVESADRGLIAGARVFDVYEGKGVPQGFKSVAVEAMIQPRDATLTDAQIEALSAKITAAAEKQLGAKLRS